MAKDRQFLWFAQSMEHALTFGIEHWADGFPDKEQHAQDNSHFYYSAMLVSMMTHLAGKMGDDWFDSYKGNWKRHLKVLKIIRNAIVHNDGDVRKTYSKRNPNIVRAYHDDLEAQAINWRDGKPFPIYFEYNGDDIVTLKNESLQVLQSLWVKISKDPVPVEVKKKKWNELLANWICNESKYLLTRN